MGYNTDFEGSVTVTPPLNPHEVAYLRTFMGTRHMRRRSGPYFTDGSDEFGQDADVLDYHRPPPGQPELWCWWEPSEDGTAIGWNGAEKFRSPAEWMVYVIDTFLKPGATVQEELQRRRVPGRVYPAEFGHFTFDHVVEGVINAHGQAPGDEWKLIVTANVVTEQHAHLTWDESR